MSDRTLFQRIAAPFRHRDNANIGYLFILPSFVLLLTFVVIPIIWSFVLTFQKWSILSPGSWVGLKNYVKLFTRDVDYWNAFRNTAVFAVIKVPLSIFLSLVVAVVMNRKFAGVNIFRSIFFLPVIVSTVAISVIWLWMYDRDYGLINYGLSLFGIKGPDWLGNPDIALYSLVIVDVWKGIGYMMVIYLAGLQGISTEFYNAAKVDGASTWQLFWKITLPLIAPTTFFLAITSFIGSLQVYTIVYAMTDGGPLKATEVVAWLIWKVAFQQHNMGYAAAQSFMLFAVIFAVTLFQVRYMNKKLSYQ
jgi:multiple sugar transport system permease protein